MASTLIGSLRIDEEDTNNEGGHLAMRPTPSPHTRTILRRLLETPRHPPLADAAILPSLGLCLTGIWWWRELTANHKSPGWMGGRTEFSHVFPFSPILRLFSTGEKTLYLILICISFR
jgi:hypothetical protein